MSIILQNARIITETGEFQTVDIKIKNGKIEKIASRIEEEGSNIINCKEKLVSAGFIDLHVHLREPGGEKKETIVTGTLAAAKGGFTTVAAMPNTRPVPDTVEHMDDLMERINETAHVRVLPYASITVRQTGKELTDFQSLKQAGAFAFTDDGVGVQSAKMMFEAMKKAAENGYSIVAHCEDNSLIYGGSVHDGVYAKQNNLPGIPSVCESVHIARDVLLAEATGCHYHVCHISTKESVRVVRDAKKAGINVTCEVTPHHLLLCDEDIEGVNPNFKMNPPLRSKEDREALIEGLLDGTIDFIATDHAPHTEEEKSEGMKQAPFGIVGLETAFPLLYTHFVKRNVFTLKQLMDWLTVKPAERFGLNLGQLQEGALADLTVIDLDHEADINPNEFVSKGKNTPFAGWTCNGWPILTMVNGEIVWEKDVK
ncbi:dihydroorotase [Bacillus sp. FJAT-47783]|uniref:dihydroorotase n=1 Tax=Bacillus sp. FJAT-47783 TaxID=2922712 RepID=UPI001FAD1B91|nr:dihydroorotase [Bacillus sp. FJAT-47783]